LITKDKKNEKVIDLENMGNISLRGRHAHKKEDHLREEFRDMQRTIANYEPSEGQIFSNIFKVI
jgi:hypothetical protein